MSEDDEASAAEGQRSESRPRKKKKKKAARAIEAAPLPPPIVEGWAPPWLGYLAIAVAGVYLALVFSDAAGWQWFGNRFPRPLHYFGQVAALFPKADTVATDYYAEGWLCREQRWVELDLRPWFPIDADEKENRFSRTMGFYGRGRAEDIRAAMNALDEYIVIHENQARSGGATSGGSTGVLGGIRTSRVAIPLPTFGDHVERYARRKLVDVPRGWRRRQYYTKLSKRAERCKAAYPEYDDRGLVDDRERGEKAPERPAERGPVDAPAPEESEP